MPRAESICCKCTMNLPQLSVSTFSEIVVTEGVVHSLTYKNEDWQNSANRRIRLLQFSTFL